MTTTKRNEEALDEHVSSTANKMVDEVSDRLVTFLMMSTVIMKAAREEGHEETAKLIRELVENSAAKIIYGVLDRAQNSTVWGDADANPKH